MKVIYKGRGNGKTHDLVLKSYETGYPIVCYLDCNIKHVKYMANKLNVNIPEPLSFSQLVNTIPLGNPVLIDNAEFILQSIIPVPIDTISINNELQCESDNFTPKLNKFITDNNLKENEILDALKWYFKK